MKENYSYHAGERYLQKLSGVDSMADKIAGMMLDDKLSLQQQTFYSQLNTLYIASLDASGKPWASIITGQKGFVFSVDEKHIKICAQPLNGDVLFRNIQENKELGVLGLEHHTRRRNRLAGEVIECSPQGILIKVKQAYGNCPKYIRPRESIIVENPNRKYLDEPVLYSALNAEIKQLISRADTFYIASFFLSKTHCGGDMSHRGGEPGFVCIVGDHTLEFDDYAGNNLYMTLGNLYANSDAGILFINYENSDVWQLQCVAKIIETPGKRNKRRIKLEIKSIRKNAGALNVRWVSRV